MIMKFRWGTRRREMKEIPKDTTPKSTRTGRGPEAQAQEGRDPAGMTELLKEDIIVKIGGETPTQIGEIIALIEGIIALREGAEEIIVQDKGQTREGRGAEETILLIRVEGTLDKRGEGVARGPMVMEDP